MANGWAGLDRDEKFCVWEVATWDATCDNMRLPIYADSIVWAPGSSAVAYTLDAFLNAYASDLCSSSNWNREPASISPAMAKTAIARCDEQGRAG